MQLAKQLSLLFELYKIESNDGLNESEIDSERLEQGLDSKILERYRKARKKGTSGIAILEGGACSSCHSVYDKPYAFWGGGWFINTCAFCSTLLIGYEPGAQTSSYPVISNSGSHLEWREFGSKRKEKQPTNEQKAAIVQKG